MTILCIVYVSEGLRHNVINILHQAALSLPTSLTGAKLAHFFRDQIYNRTSFYFVGEKEDVINRAVSLCCKAFDILDFREHSGSHPTLGSVDHVCFSPLQNTSSDSNNDYQFILDEACDAARQFSCTIHSLERVNVFFYGHLSPVHRKLADTRRALGYFQDGHKIEPQLSCWERLRNKWHSSGIIPDVGNMEEEVDGKKGIMCVGSIPFVLNFNIRFDFSNNLSSIKQVTKHIRGPHVCQNLYAFIR